MTVERGCMKMRRRDRATVLILVVAVLALLAVMGTVYVVASRSERDTSAAMSSGVNLNLARSAIVEMTRGAIGDSMLDSNGNIGRYVNGGTSARNFDAAEVGVSTFGQCDTNSNMRDEPWLCQKLHVPPINQYCNEPPNALYPNVPVGDAFRAIDTGAAADGIGDFTRLTQNFYNPKTGVYDLPVSGMTRGKMGGKGVTSNTSPYDNSFAVVCDDTNDCGYGTPIFGPGTNTITDTNSDDPATQWGRLQNEFDGANSDAYIQLLPFCDANGTRYRFGIRIIDTNRMANLNTSSTEDPNTASQDPNGSFITSLRLTGFAQSASNTAYMDYQKNTYFDYGKSQSGAYSSLAKHDTYNYLDVKAPGRNPSGSFSPQGWMAEILHMERPSSTVNYFDLSDELGLRAYGEYGTSYHVRPALFMGGSANANFVWPYTLSNDSTCAGSTGVYSAGTIPSAPSNFHTGNARRKNYTTYSWSREIRPYADPPVASIYTLTPNDGKGTGGFPGFPVTPAPATPSIWPPTPARVAANPTVSATDDNAALFFIAMAATNIATAMGDSTSSGSDPNFTQVEQCSFAANYITTRSNVLKKDPGIPGNTYYVQAGPSFIDDQGIHIRTVGISGSVIGRDFGGAASNDLKAPAGKVVLGYSAQPFINEVAAIAHAESPDGVTYQAVVTDSAVELFNPYNVDLSLQDYELEVPQADGSYKDVPLTKCWIPKNGYFVYYNGTSPNGALTIAAGAQKLQDPNFKLLPNGGQVVLLRRYTDRNNATAWAPVDYSICADAAGTPLIPLVGTLPTADTTYSIQRKSGATSTGAAPWSAACNQFDAPSPNPTLGAANSSPGNPNIQLWDRSFEQLLTSATAVRSPFENIGALNHVMRLGHVFAAPVATPVDLTTVSTLGDQLLSAANPKVGSRFDNMSKASGVGHFATEYIEAQLHFDFFANPQVFKSSPPSDTAISLGPSDVDIRAIKLLDHLAMVDRVSDPTINVGGGALDINKIRLPGQINVNTASPDVLRALPGVQGLQTVSTSMPDKVVANICAYRRRLGPADLSSGTGCWYNGITNGNTIDYSASATYPGKGFRGMSELLYPICAANPTANPTSLDARDKAWATIYNLCTVRSDTFIVYGYIQAVRPLPSFTGFNNAMHWYEHRVVTDPTTAAVTSGNNSVQLVGMAQRRFIAIVDRSFCNYPKGQMDANGNPLFALPRVVAIQDLPY